MPPRTAEPPLYWASDSRPGIRRRRCGAGFAYAHSDGSRLRDVRELARIRRLAIPPAYRDVWICPDANGHLQATGRDARGRKQYRYHPRWQEERARTKFDRLLAFGALLPRLRARVRRLLAGSAQPTRLRVLAAIVRLLDSTGLRIGNEAYARSNGSYGLCTLRTDHASVRGEKIRLSFVGKSGVRHERTLADRGVSAVVRRCRELPGQELFQYLDDDGAVRSIGSGDVNAWLAQATGAAVTAKDFRTWQASVHALELTLAACLDGDTKTSARAVELLATVARRLGNTVAVCRKSYVHPAVLDCTTALGDPEERARLLQRRWVGKAPPGPRDLSVAERRLMSLLREARRAGRSGRGVAGLRGLSGGSPRPPPAPGRAGSAPAGGCA